MPKHLLIRLCTTLWLAAALRGTASAAPNAPEIPEPLRPWIDWVLHGHEDARCPFLSGAAEQRQCLWPARLTVEIEDRSGRFTQQWLVHRDGWVPLPGDERLWPQDVRVDGQPATLTQIEGAPRVRLARGTHAITGVFEWDAVPEVLPVPTATALLALTVRGERVPFPLRDEHGRLWLQQRAASEQEENRLDIVVHRRLEDDIPVRLVTRIELRVSGAGREMALGKALPAAFIPMSLDSALPARLDPDGSLRAQVRPGNWTIDLIARHDGPASALTLPDPDGEWDTEEVWVFDARPNLRLVTVQGVTAVDPQQTELPPEWRHLPAYVLRPGDTMTLTEKQRGDADPAADRLSLQRTWWLDFDGGGYTLRDQITGTMSRSWRLEMPPPAVLGRVAIAGQDQFITRLGGSAAVGVETRQGEVQIDADSRLAGAAGDLPAVNWAIDFQDVAGQLNLPPGWRLLHASGVDDAAPTWVATWTLLDLFVVLIVAMAAARLWGRLPGALALLTLGLTYIEPGAPRGVWLFVLAAETLVRILPSGRLLPVAKLARLFAVVLLVLTAVPFMVREIRQAMYPALGRPAAGPPAALTGAIDQRRLEPPVPSEMGRLMAEESVGGAAYMKLARRAMYQHDIDPQAVVQTGPGLPTWKWSAVALRWRGPVEHTQRLHLRLLSPRFNAGLAVLRILLLSALVVVVLRAGRSSGLLSGAALALLFTGWLLAPGKANAEMPPPDLLNELRARVLAPPDCHPHCAASARLQLEITATTLRGRMAVDTAAETAIPLPGSAAHWVPETVLADDQPAAGLMRAADGGLWIQLSAGRHVLLFHGELPERDTVQIPLPLKPHRVEARATGWRLDGVYENGLADDVLQLTRLRAEGDGPGAALRPGTLPPFARVRRQLRLGLTWQVDTTIERLTPVGAAMVLEVPLLPGESVTSAGVRVAGGKALVNMAPQAAAVSWTSLLPETARLALQAPAAVSFTEVWRLDASPIWHVVPEGIPTVQTTGDTETRIREWQPWPGEGVTLAISRPAGVPGQTLTIDRSALSVSPGARTTEVSLSFTARSSRGGQHGITLPEGADLQSVIINGSPQPIRQEQRVVTVPLVPGTQTVQLAWRQRGGIARRFVAPEIDLGAPSVNSDLQIAMPADRWTLAVGGPRLGPAVLFWSLLAVVALVAFGLARVRLTPLGAGQWFLLGVGLTQVPTSVGMIVAGWLLALGWRQRHGAALSDGAFNVFQLLLVAWTGGALAGLVWSIQQGLLGLPEMQIGGNGSSAQLLRWYQDIVADRLPRPWVFSLPLLVYRLAMLAWALWLARALLRWLSWGWGCFTGGGLWRPLRRQVVEMRTPGGASTKSATP